MTVKMAKCVNYRRCGRPAKGPYARFCTPCFATNAKLKGSYSSGNSRGNPGNVGNSRASVKLRNARNVKKGTVKKDDGKSSGLRCSARKALVVKKITAIRGNPGNAGNSSANDTLRNAGIASASGTLGNAVDTSARGNPANVGNVKKAKAEKDAGKRSGLKCSAKKAVVVKKNMAIKAKMPKCVHYKRCGRLAKGPYARFCTRCFLANSRVKPAKKALVAKKNMAIIAKMPKCEHYKRCGRLAKGPYARFCTRCFVTNAKLKGSASFGNSSGNPGNAGNVSARGILRNAGNASASGKLRNAGNASARGCLRNAGNVSASGYLRNVGNASASGNPRNAGNANASGTLGNAGNTSARCKLRNASVSGNLRCAGIVAIKEMRGS